MNHHHALKKYFLLRREMSIRSVLGRDPTSSRVSFDGMTGSLEILCDVGVALATLSQEHRDAIYDRWELWFELEDAHVEVSNWSRKAVSSLIANRRGARKTARKRKKDCIHIADELKKRLDKIDRSRVYREAVSRLEI